jgi:hypothetical protein
MVRPYHGVQWLENRGNLEFEYHELLRLYGAYRALPGDFDADGDLDIVATSLLNDWADPARKSLILLENDGKQHFTARGIANAPTHLVTAAVGDLDGDGRPDVLRAACISSRHTIGWAASLCGEIREACGGPASNLEEQLLQRD